MHKEEIDITKCFFFIPQLINMLNTDNFYCAQAVLMKILEKYPQSIFLHLRSIVDKNSSINQKHKTEICNLILNTEKDTSLSYSRITNLFGSSSFYLASTFFTLDKIVSDLITKMQCSYEEDCYRMSDAIFNESINKIFDNSPYSCNDLAILIDRMNRNLEKSKIGLKYKKEFNDDFYGNKDITLVDLAKKALKWTSIFKNILKSVPVVINLGIIRTINDYNSFNFEEVQVFGQYNEIRNIYDNFVTIESFEPATISTWRNGTSIKRVAIRGNNGKKYIFAFCDPISNVYRREDRCIQLAEFMHSETEYNVRFKSYVNLSEKSRLIRLHEDYYFYDDILSENLITKGYCIGDLIFKYLGFLNEDSKHDVIDNKNETEITKKEYENNDNNFLNENQRSEESNILENLIDDEKKFKGDEENSKTDDLFTNQNNTQNLTKTSQNQKITIKEVHYNFSKKSRYEAYKRLCKELGDKIIVDFFKEKLFDCDINFFYRKQALSSFSCRSVFLYLFAVSLRSPCRIAIGKNTADCYNLDVFPFLNKEYKFITEETVPLRLTPNIQKYFDRAGIEGIFSKISYGMCKSLQESDYYRDLFFLCLGDEDGFGREKKLLLSNFECVEKRMKQMIENLCEVLNESTNPDNLCMMNPLWHPWF
ncbi:transcription-associated protein 1 [Gurleya vavrai]